MRELEDGTNGAANFVLAGAEDDRWLPEVRRLLPFRDYVLTPLHVTKGTWLPVFCG